MADSPQEPIVLLPGEGRSIDLGNFTMSVKADGPATGEAFALLESIEPPNFGPPLHIHDSNGEAFYVLEGSYLIFIRDAQYECPVGSFVFIPAGTEHGFRVGSEASRKLILYTPAAMVGYFDELSTAIQEGRADDERLGKIATRYGMEVTGPTPEGYL